MGMFLQRQAVQHAGAGVDAAVGGGDRRGEGDEVDQRGGGGQARFVKQRHKRTGLRRDVRPGGHRDNHHHRQHIENNNTQRNGANGARQNFFRRFGLRRHGAKQLHAGVGEDSDLETGEKAHYAVRHKHRRFGQVA